MGISSGGCQAGKVLSGPSPWEDFDSWTKVLEYTSEVLELEDDPWLLTDAVNHVRTYGSEVGGPQPGSVPNMELVDWKGFWACYNHFNNDTIKRDSDPFCCNDFDYEN